MSDHGDRVPRPDEFEDLMRSLSGSGDRSDPDAANALHSLFDPLAEPARPSRRRPRREETVTYRVRVEVAGTEPPVWRRLELASDLFLNEVHAILQAAFAWEDYHMHGFASGPSYYSREAEYYLSPFEADGGKAGVPEEEVRLDEVLAQPGDRMSYLYDFGDNWEHLLTLQEVAPRQEDAPPAVCTAGSRPAPPEDCGGVPGYELVSAATDPGHPHHAEALAEYRELCGENPAPDRAPVPFDIDAVNAALTAVSGPLPDNIPGPVGELLASVRDPGVRGRLLTLVAKATSQGDDEPTAATVRAAVGAYAWLLDHIGDDGVKLTGAGYLPPASVQEAAGALGLSQTWIGKANRESQTLPVLNLRESAQRMGLLRKYKGRLLPTAAAKAVRDDPRALWDHLAGRMPPQPRAEVERKGCLLMVLAVAAGSRDVPGEVAEALTGLGWRTDQGLPVDPAAARDAAYEAWIVLDTLGGWSKSSFGRGTAPTARGVAFARAALRHRP